MLHQLPNVSGSYILASLGLRHDRKLCISVVCYKFAFALFVFFILYAVRGLSICSVVPVFVLCLVITKSSLRLLLRSLHSCSGFVIVLRLVSYMLLLVLLLLSPRSAFVVGLISIQIRISLVALISPAMRTPQLGGQAWPQTLTSERWT